MAGFFYTQQLHARTLSVFESLFAFFVSFPEITYVQKCMRKWRKIASLWGFELDANSGPLGTDDFGEISVFGETLQGAGDIQNVANIQFRRQKRPLQIR